MSNSSVTIIGNLTRDPEVKYLPSGQAVTTLGVAVNRSWKNKDDEWVEETSFIDVKAWRDLAEQCSILEKGVRLVATGDLKQESWESDDGPRSKVVLNARDIGISLTAIDGFDRRVRESKGSGGNAKATKSAKQFEDTDDEPF